MLPDGLKIEANKHGLELKLNFPKGTIYKPKWAFNLPALWC